MALTGIQLRCGLEETEVFTTAAPIGGVTSGAMAIVNDVVGFYLSDAEEADITTFVFRARRVMAPCAVSAGYAVGEKVYFDNTQKEVTQTATSNTLCGIVTRAAGSDDTTVEIFLDGALGVVA